MMMIAAAGLLLPGVALSQSEKSYEIQRDMPLFLDSLKTEFTYPMAWGNSDINDFDKWKEAAKGKLVEEMLLPPPRANSYDLVILES